MIGARLLDGAAGLAAAGLGPALVFWPRRAVLVGVLAYAVAFSFVTVTRHLTFATHALDLGS